jgi:hypothetical protein
MNSEVRNPYIFLLSHNFSSQNCIYFLSGEVEKGQRAKGKGQRAEGRRQKAEGRRQKAEHRR